MPVRKRMHEVAEIAKTLLGVRRTDAVVRIDKEYLELRVWVRGGKRATVARLNYELLVIIVEEALDMSIRGQHVKGHDLHVYFAGTPARAEDARAESPRRKRRRWLLRVASYALFTYAAGKFVCAMHVLYEDPAARTYEAYLYAAGCAALLGLWVFYHFLFRHTPLGPVMR